MIGDSQRFSATGTAYGKTFLEKHLGQKNQMILWGYTGRGEAGEATHEVNQLVNNFLEREKLFGRCLANVVDIHTVKAIREWGCNVATNNINFYLVHGNALFGDDVLSSDSLTDSAICLEGGVQSFRQLVNFISRGIEIHGVFNLRGPLNPATFNKKLNQYLIYFSAVEFLYLLSEELKAKFPAASDAPVEFIEAFKDNYRQTHHLFNPDANDAMTKSALFAAGWEQFITEKLWLKLDKCHFEEFKGQLPAIQPNNHERIQPAANPQNQVDSTVSEK